MRAGLRDGPVPANADGGWLHDIAGETRVVAPARFEAFAAGRGLAAATVRDWVVRLPALSSRPEPARRAMRPDTGSILPAGHPDGP